jgi:hypothetical protein
LSKSKLINSPIAVGITATFIGLFTFVLSWHFFEFWQGPMPGYSVLFFAGNVSLIYLWHPLFTEEIALYPKLGLLLLGQFVLVTVFYKLLLTVLKCFKRR